MKVLVYVKKQSIKCLMKNHSFSFEIFANILNSNGNNIKIIFKTYKLQFNQNYKL